MSGHSIVLALIAKWSEGSSLVGIRGDSRGEFAPVGTEFLKKQTKAVRDALPALSERVLATIVTRNSSRFMTVSEIAEDDLMIASGLPDAVLELRFHFIAKGMFLFLSAAQPDCPREVQEAFDQDIERVYVDAGTRPKKLRKHLQARMRYFNDEKNDPKGVVRVPSAAAVRKTRSEIPPREVKKKKRAKAHRKAASVGDEGASERKPKKPMSEKTPLLSIQAHEGDMERRVVSWDDRIHRPIAAAPAAVILSPATPAFILAPSLRGEPVHAISIGEDPEPSATFGKWKYRCVGHHCFDMRRRYGPESRRTTTAREVLDRVLRNLGEKRGFKRPKRGGRSGRRKKPEAEVEEPKHTEFEITDSGRFKIITFQARDERVFVAICGIRAKLENVLSMFRNCDEKLPISVMSDAHRKRAKGLLELAVGSANTAYAQEREEKQKALVHNLEAIEGMASELEAGHQPDFLTGLDSMNEERKKKKRCVLISVIVAVVVTLGVVLAMILIAVLCATLA